MSGRKVAITWSTPGLTGCERPTMKTTTRAALVEIDAEIANLELVKKEHLGTLCFEDYAADRKLSLLNATIASLKSERRATARCA